MPFTHIDENGRAKMVDVSGKEVTLRRAVAGGEVRCAAETVRLILAREIPKGDVFAAARIAGIMAAKKTAEIIPLCHSIPVQSVAVEISADASSGGCENGVITVTAEAAAEAKTGVEMEALTAVAGACLCIYDMCKAVDRGMVVGNIRLLRKSGGRSEYIRGED